jgi:hypothetical protein
MNWPAGHCELRRSVQPCQHPRLPPPLLLIGFGADLGGMDFGDGEEDGFDGLAMADPFCG